MKKEDWTWMPHPTHFICSNYCRFVLATEVGGYIISTVGEYVPDSNLRDVLAGCRGITLKGKGDERERDWIKKNGFENLSGEGQTYETMVFSSLKTKNNECCPYQIVLPDVDSRRYKYAGDAYKGHLKLCEKWSKKD